MMITVVFITSPSYLEPALHLVHELGHLVKIHLIIQVAPESWNNALFNVPQTNIQSGIYPADKILNKYFPDKIHRYWGNLASSYLVVYNCVKSLHLSTIMVNENIIKLINKIRPDIIHFDDISLRMALSFWRFYKTSIVLSLHDSESHSGESNWRKEFARRIVFPMVDKYILHNRHDKKVFIKKYNIFQNRVKTIPLGYYHIYRELKMYKSKKKCNQILFFGRISKYKGLDIFIKAARMVSDRIPNINFIIAGKQSTNFIFPNLPNLSHGCKFITILDYIPNNKLVELFHNACIVVCPYLDATQSGVLLTAYAFGKPVVTTKVGGLPEYVKNNVTGLLVPPGDANSLANAIINLLQNPAKMIRMRRLIKDLNKNELSWNVIAKKTHKIYREALDLNGC